MNRADHTYNNPDVLHISDSIFDLQNQNTALKELGNLCLQIDSDDILNIKGFGTIIEGIAEKIEQEIDTIKQATEQLRVTTNEQ